MKKRFSIDKDETDFIQPCKLTRQKRWTENPQEFVQLEHKALNIINYNIAGQCKWLTCWVHTPEITGSSPAPATVAVAELAMRQIVVLNYAGSSPVGQLRHF